MEHFKGEVYKAIRWYTQFIEWIVYLMTKKFIKEDWPKIFKEFYRVFGDDAYSDLTQPNLLSPI